LRFRCDLVHERRLDYEHANDDEVTKHEDVKWPRCAWRQ
jgi:hypothetical protein